MYENEQNINKINYGIIIMKDKKILSMDFESTPLYHL